MKQTKTFFEQTLRMLAALMLCLLVAPSVSSCKDDDDEPNGISYAIRGYWICDYSDLALEIISTEDYYKMKGETPEGQYYPTDNVYQLWSIADDSPECWVLWTTCLGYFNFHDSDYDWRDKPYISSCTDNQLSLDGVDFYVFRRVSKQEFDRIVKRSGNNNGNNGGNNTDVANIVKNYSQCTATYSDYYVNVEINHTILSKLPNAKISYEIGHSERGSSSDIVITGGRHPLNPQISISGESTSVKIPIPIYYYFIAKYLDEETHYGDLKYYTNAAEMCEMCLGSYDALKNKTSMTSEEKELYDSVIKYLNEYQSEVRGSYTVWVYIIVDGKSYLLKKINV